MSNQSNDNVVRFRIDPGQYALLERRASYLGESVGQYVKRRIQGMLEEEEGRLYANEMRLALSDAQRSGAHGFATLTGANDTYVQVFRATLPLAEV